jgi:hypothetical protein
VQDVKIRNRCCAEEKRRSCEFPHTLISRYTCY